MRINISRNWLSVKAAEASGLLDARNENRVSAHDLFTPEENIILNDLTRPYLVANRFETVCGMGKNASVFYGVDKTRGKENKVFTITKTRSEGQSCPHYMLDVGHNGMLWEGVDFKKIHRVLTTNLQSMYPGVVDSPKEMILPAKTKSAARRFSIV
jgi:hypothetical protein